jgi:hypothetical protein
MIGSKVSEFTGRVVGQAQKADFLRIYQEADMRKVAIIAIAVLAILAVGCNKDSVTGPSTETLTGTWKATKAEYVNVANSSIKVDIVSQGSTVTLVLEASTYTFTTSDARVQPSIASGSWSSSKDTLTLKPTGASFTIIFDMALNGSTLTLNGGGVMFDFNADGNFVDATLNMVLARQ